MNDLEKRNKAFEQQIRDLKAKQIELISENKRLKEDPVYLEKVAREKMGLGKEGEMVIKIIPSEAPKK